MSSKFFQYITYVMYLLITLLVTIMIFVVYDGIMNTSKKSITPVINNTETEKNLKDIQTITKIPQLIINDVPFTPQAPFGNWGNIIYEDGCEEASILMAISWSRGEVLTPEKANIEIKNISDFETKIFGNFLDTSVQDTARIMKEYFEFNQFNIKENIVKNDIIDSLNKGNIVLVPAYGRDLKNPHYTPPGPIAHMLVVIGYDSLSNEFITNDPGTKSGEKYKYNEDVLFDAIRGYPTSANKLEPPIAGEARIKIIIEVFKK